MYEFVTQFHSDVYIDFDNAYIVFIILQFVFHNVHTNYSNANNWLEYIFSNINIDESYSHFKFSGSHIVFRQSCRACLSLSGCLSPLVATCTYLSPALRTLLPHHDLRSFPSCPTTLSAVTLCLCPIGMARRLRPTMPGSGPGNPFNGRIVPHNIGLHPPNPTCSLYDLRVFSSQYFMSLFNSFLVLYSSSCHSFNSLLFTCPRFSSVHLCCLSF
jgi:hypothetical protein